MNCHVSVYTHEPDRLIVDLSHKHLPISLITPGKHKLEICIGSLFTRREFRFKLAFRFWEFDETSVYRLRISLRVIFSNYGHCFSPFTASALIGI